MSVLARARPGLVSCSLRATVLVGHDDGTRDRVADLCRTERPAFELDRSTVSSAVFPQIDSRRVAAMLIPSRPWTGNATQCMLSQFNNAMYVTGADASDFSVSISSAPLHFSVSLITPHADSCFQFDHALMHGRKSTSTRSIPTHGPRRARPLRLPFPSPDPRLSWTTTPTSSLPSPTAV